MWKAKAIKLFAKELPQNPRLAHLFRVEARLEAAEVLDAPPERPLLPAGEEGAPGDEDELAPVLAEESLPMSLGAAESLPLTMKGGAVRTLAELSSSALERIREQARERLDQEPENAELQRAAEGCTVVLEARAEGRSREPQRKADVAG